MDKVVIGDATLYTGSCLDVLPMLDADSVHCVVTSPPYWGLRDYGTATWEGGDAECDHKVRVNARDIATSGLEGGKQNCNHQLEGYHDICRRCGARRVDAGIGLEPTFAEWLERMVAVMREVRRVLRPDGVCWVNCGDAYAANRGGTAYPAETLAGGVSGKGDEKTKRGRGDGYQAKRDPNGHCLKHKDLLLMPARLAIALQEPYYTGSIKRESDRAWLAAAIEGEGCMYIHKRKAGQANGQGYHRKNDSYGAGLEVANTSETFVKRCLEITGKGSICHQDKDRRQRLYRWNLRSNECRDIIREVYPHMASKRHEARLILGCPSSGEKAKKAHESVIALHNGNEPTIDFPEPPSMYEPMFYVRSEVVWSKKNPMPESVTDRPTSAHEKVYLLTKQARYYYDADAVREAHQADSLERYEHSFERDKQSDTGFVKADAYQTVHGNPSGRNLRNVWHIATAPFAEAHFATFPPELARRCIAAGTSEHGCCPKCGKPWARVTKPADGYEPNGSWDKAADDDRGELAKRGRGKTGKALTANYETLGWQPACTCGGDPVPCTVLDPFSGAATTGLTALKLGRRYIGIELSPEYNAMALKRIQDEANQMKMF